MTVNEPNTHLTHPVSSAAHRAYWLRQYAAAYANRDKRAAAVALLFAQRGSGPGALRIRERNEQLG